MDIEIDGANIRSEANFHSVFAEVMDLAPYYGAPRITGNFRVIAGRDAGSCVF